MARPEPVSQSDAGACGTPGCGHERVVQSLHGQAPPDDTGTKQAEVASVHSILVIAYRLLDRHVSYLDLGGDYFAHRLSEQAHIRRLVAQLERLGDQITIEPMEAPAA